MTQMEEWLTAKTDDQFISTLESLVVVHRIVGDATANGESTKPTLDEAQSDLQLARAELLRRLAESRRQAATPAPEGDVHAR